MNLAPSTRVVATAPEPRRNTIEAIYATAHWLLARDRISEAATVLQALIHVAPHDERGWLALGECHERIEQPLVALQLYGAGSVITRSTGLPSARCEVARARVLRALGRDDESAEALERATVALEASDDDGLATLVR